MTRLALAVSAAGCLLSSQGAAADALKCPIGATRARAADIAEAKSLLGETDGFVTALSPFDRAARVKSDTPVDARAYLDFVVAQAQPWTAAERTALEREWCTMASRIAEKHWRLSLPKVVLFIKTTGLEEGHAAYTRGNAVVFPIKALGAGSLGAQLPHELFHVFSRHLAADATGRARRDALYRIVGYQPLGSAFKVPAPYADRAITNPDGYEVAHGIDVQRGGQSMKAVPLLYADPPRYSRARGGDFFEYLKFALLPVRLEGSEWVAQRGADGQPVLVDPMETNYLAIVGRNTDELFHPDELLADNFALALGYGQPRDPGQVEKVAAALGQMGDP